MWPRHRRTCLQLRFIRNAIALFFFTWLCSVRNIAEEILQPLYLTCSCSKIISVAVDYWWNCHTCTASNLALCQNLVCGCLTIDDKRVTWPIRWCPCGAGVSGLPSLFQDVINSESRQHPLWQKKISVGFQSVTYMPCFLWSDRQTPLVHQSK